MRDSETDPENIVATRRVFAGIDMGCFWLFSNNRLNLPEFPPLVTLMQPPVLRWLTPDDQDDAADEEQQKQKLAANELRTDRLRRVEAAILSTPQGREWVWGLISGDCDVWEKKIALSGSHEQAYFDGRRSIGQGLLRRLIRSSPQNFALMFTENDKIL